MTRGNSVTLTEFRLGIPSTSPNLTANSFSTLHDVGPNYIVMGLVAEETLAERVTRSALPLEGALAITRQLVDALEVAH
jgi:hypothetical protein